MMTRDRLAAVHLAKKSLGLSEEHYREILSGFGVTTSKDLTSAQFPMLMKFFERLGYVNPDRGTRKSRAGRSVGLIDAATDSQISYIYHLWETAPTVKVKTEEALMKFVKRMTTVDDWQSVTRIDASKVITAINKL
jgi:hypothetical protein